MVTRAVPHLQEALGDNGVNELILLVDDRLRERAVPRDEYNQVVTHLTALEQRLVDRFIEMDRHFEVRFEEMNRHFENRFDALERRLEDRLDKRFEQMQQQLEAGVDSRLGAMEQRLDKMEQRLDKMEQRLDKMDQRLVEWNREMNQRLDQIYDRMLVQSRWLIGSIALLGTVISVLLAIGQFVK